MRTTIIIMLLLAFSCRSPRQLISNSSRTVDSVAEATSESTFSRVVSSDICGRRTVSLIRFAPLTPELAASGVTTPPVDEVLQVIDEVTAKAADSIKRGKTSKSNTSLISDAKDSFTEKESLKWWHKALIWVGVVALALAAIKLIISKITKRVKL